MLDTMLETIITGSTISSAAFLECTLVSIILGIGVAALCMFKNKYSQSFAVTLAMLPAIVAVVIMLVNGNIGAGVAVAGSFSLVRFRSAAGTAREIGMIFLAMAIGLATGMGYVVLAVIFFLIIAILNLVLTAFNFGGRKENDRELRVTIPEDLDYEGLFDDLFESYTEVHELDRVKTTNMGTLYELTYRIVLKEKANTKAFMDGLRERNGNLTIVCGRPVSRELL